MSPGVPNPFQIGKRRPLVVGHRGVPTLHQENTLAGFRRARALGIPAIELDVRLTADRRAVVFHDSSLKRLTGSTASVHDLTWDRLSRLRIRREVPMGLDVHGERIIKRYDREERIPLFEEVLAEVGSTLAINVELKLDVGRWWQTEVGVVAAQILADAHAEDHVIVTSFDVRKLRAARRVNPALIAGFCFDDSMLEFANPLLERMWPAPPGGPIRSSARWVLNQILEANLTRFVGTRVVGAEHTLVGSDTVRRLHHQGVAIGTHTLFPIGTTTGKPIAPSAATTAEVDRLVGLGVDWIESDDPERLLSLIG